MAEPTTTDAPTDGRLLRGERTRRVILQRAMDMASVDGLEGLSIGRLAADLDVSKSGVITHFGSKEELQLATVRAAIDVFTENVVRPALAAPTGLRRLWRLCELWLDYERGIFPGGCFFANVAAEFDARPGRVRDAIAQSQRDFRTVFERVIAGGVAVGELHDDVDAAQLTFELKALGASANNEYLLYDEPAAYERARRAMLTRLRSVATDPSSLPDA
jgi:AcrR family transcriptional regulator